ncbi:MAG: LytTR family DNA-binding domain-containing protein, partial [Defluviitaleaceae bacterium]|nr:LytTR family DNA-binding domain-containing protein [Defluviitaleaceae bacterium]
ALCVKMEAGTHYDLIFLDIEFAGMHGRAACGASGQPENAINGVEVGRLIRETHKNNTTAIVYISWKMKYSMELFDIRPLHFLIKPLDYKKVAQVVKTYLNIAGQGTQNFTYKVGHNIYKVPMKDIVYLQSDKRKVTAHLADGSTEAFYGTLPDVYEAQLKGLDFLFIHTSYVVNYDYIKAVKYKEVVLTTGETPLPISRPKRADVRETYFAIMESRRV